MNKVTFEYRNIVRLFNDISCSKSMWQVFSDCIEIYSLSISNSFDVGKAFEMREMRYAEIIKDYSKEQLVIISKIFVEIAFMIEENPFRDTLGELYMQLGMGSKESGQFFTPYVVSHTLAKEALSRDTVNKLISAKKYITILEPAVGGGANAIAACEVLKSYDIDYQAKAVFVCQDLTKITAMMCHVVLSLIGCSAVIKIGDTLTEPYTNYANERRKGAELLITPMFAKNNCFEKV